MRPAARRPERLNEPGEARSATDFRPAWTRCSPVPGRIWVSLRIKELLLGSVTVGLHNKFPSYFYKRGNLFNTYLGHTEQPEAPVKSKPSSKARSKPKSTTKKVQAASPRPKGAAEQLAAFAKKHMSAEETLRFLELIAADCNVSLRRVQANRQMWREVAYFASTYLTEERSLRFLRVLKQRRQAGEALVQR